jgi:hypothetical protein
MVCANGPALARSSAEPGRGLRAPADDRRRFQIVWVKPPGTRCEHCGGTEGTVYLIRIPSTAAHSEALHKACAAPGFDKEKGG